MFQSFQIPLDMSFVLHNYTGECGNVQLLFTEANPLAQRCLWFQDYTGGADPTVD